MSAFLRNVGKVSNAEAVSLKTRFGRRRVGGKLFRNLGPLRVVSASTGGDPYFASVVSLLHMNGTDASTTFSDAFRTWTAAGNAQIDTAQSMFGGASGLFDGTDDYVSTASSADFNFGTGDFTVEFRARLVAILGTGNATIFMSDSGRSHLIWIETGPILSFDGSAGSRSSNVLTLSVDTWYAFAISRVGDTLYFFQDGVGVGSTSCAGDTFNLNVASGGTIISSNAAGNFGLNGWMDELRVTKGVGRYSANYTVDTAAFPDS